MRGAGKSHWWAALNSENHRRYISSVFPEARITSDFDVSQGFGVGLAPTVAPGKDVLGNLQKTHNPRNIWQAVIGLHAAFPAPFPQEGTWEQKVSWVRDNPEGYETLLYEAGEAMNRSGHKRLILFDALDRLADDWQRIRPLARALFQLALDLLPNRGLRLKLFVRPDMLEDREILAFPDSSKLLARRVALTWQRADLYALLFQCLANEQQHGRDFREHCEKSFRLKWNRETATQDEAWVLPDELRSDASIQRDVFHSLVGPAMGTGPNAHKRGFPYTWLPNHLVDSRDQVSPRSFFAALRFAALSDAPPNWEFAVHYKAIQTGVQEASRIRVKEITQEDYPWVEPVMDPLRNRLTVPCQIADVVNLWSEAEVLNTIRTVLEQRADVKLLPAHISEGPSGVLRDLKDLGVIDYLYDGRIQMPDVYRIAFGLGRRGGVKPLK
jgi:hypothetical protein